MKKTSSFDQAGVIQALKELDSKLGRIPTRNEFRANTNMASGIDPLFGSYKKAVEAAGLRKKPKIEEQITRTKVTTDDGYKLKKLQDEMKLLKEYVSELEDEAMASNKLKELIGSLDTDQLGKGADWTKGAKKISSTLTGIPVLFISDVHFDEVVKAEQINYMNAYSREIAVARIKHTFLTAVQLTKRHMTSPQYEGIVVALGGDMLSGNIHEELAETNEASINLSIFLLADLLIEGISLLADEFKRVFVPCVVGNHGRLHRKPRMKNRVYDNFEWTIYQVLVRHFKNDSRVSFLIPDGADAMFQIYGKKICLTHGDQFRGGSGIAGIFSPIMLGMARKQKRQNAVHKPFDLLMMGHWHQLMMMESVLINGSVKGYDEYAYINNFGFERPQQALFIIHPEHGITYRMPIVCDTNELEKKSPGGKPKALVWGD